MDVVECTKIALTRIQNLEPENATKIIGYLLLKHNHQEVMEYAIGSEKLIQSLINEAKAYIASPLNPNLSTLMQAPPAPTMQFIPSAIPHSPPSSFPIPPGIGSFDIPPFSFTDFAGGRVPNRSKFLTSTDQLHSFTTLAQCFPNNSYYMDAVGGEALAPRTGIISSPGVLENPTRACHYFSKGFCKHGDTCRFDHVRMTGDSFSPRMFIPNLHEVANDDPVYTSGSLAKLELEITELLKARRGNPVSIASLPMIYQAMYGRTLQAEGYLTESQRHGKTGVNLTKLLARLKNIQLIDRPHGQHSVGLAEYINEKSDSSAMLGSSHQIYLTFPAESTFTNDDVLNYFSRYGIVNDVRIPRQDERMFGFVSFLHAETVKRILQLGPSHTICRSRVLVKPYKEKSKIGSKKYPENIEHLMFYPNQYLEIDHNSNSFLRARIPEEQLIEDYEQLLEFDRRRLLEMQVAHRPLTPQPFCGYELTELKLHTDSDASLPPLNTTGNHDSGHIELPDSPFASQLGSSSSSEALESR